MAERIPDCLQTQLQDTLPPSPSSTACTSEQLPNNSFKQKFTKKKKDKFLAKLCSCFNIFKNKQSKEVLAAMNTISEFTEGEVKKRGPVHVPFQDEDNIGKKTLVLDLDETLVTSSCLEFPSADLKIKIHLENGTEKNVWVKFRPGAQELLREMSELYEIIIFTASVKEVIEFIYVLTPLILQYKKYANVVIDFLDSQFHVSIRLFRENCSYDHSNNLYKDIRKLHRNMESVIIIDNQENQFKKSPENGIKVNDFKLDQHDDEELKQLIPFLRFMSGVKDVRPIERYRSAYFNCEEINYIDINDMESVFQRGKIVEEDRLATEKTESKIGQLDIGLFKEESSESGNTIKLESRDCIKNKEPQIIRHFEDDIDQAIQIQNNINNQSKMTHSRHSRRNIVSSCGSGSSQLQFSTVNENNHKSKKNEQRVEIVNDKKKSKSKQSNPSLQEVTSTISNHNNILKQVHKVAKSAFDFSAFKTSIYNKIISPRKENEKENIKDDKMEINSGCISPNNFDSSIKIQDSYPQNIDSQVKKNLLEEQSLNYFEANQTQNADNSGNFITKPKNYQKAHYHRKFLSQAMHFAEVSLKDENYNSPYNFKEI